MQSNIIDFMYVYIVSQSDGTWWLVGTWSASWSQSVICPPICCMARLKDKLSPRASVQLIKQTPSSSHKKNTKWSQDTTIWNYKINTHRNGVYQKPVSELLIQLLLVLICYVCRGNAIRVSSQVSEGWHKTMPWFKGTPGEGPRTQDMPVCNCYMTLMANSLGRVKNKRQLT